MDINELTYQIRGAVFEVNRVLGEGKTEVGLRPIGAYAPVGGSIRSRAPA